MSYLILYQQLIQKVGKQNIKTSLNQNEITLHKTFTSRIGDSAT